MHVCVYLYLSVCLSVYLSLYPSRYTIYYTWVKNVAREEKHTFHPFAFATF